MANNEQMSAEAMMERASTVLEKYTGELMGRAHVQGTGVGLLKRGGQFTNQVGIVVMVDEKVSTSQLAPGDIIPTELEGVPVDVQETGVFSAQ